MRKKNQKKEEGGNNMVPKLPTLWTTETMKPCSNLVLTYSEIHLSLF